MAFQSLFKKITDFYQSKGGLSVFHNEFVKTKIDPNIKQEVFKLCKQIRQTITKVAMKYIGSSIYQEHYQIFKPQSPSTRINELRQLDLQFLLEHFGSFHIPQNYHQAFEYMGSFMLGSNAILLGWAEFTAQRSKQQITSSQALEHLLQDPIKERDTRIASDIFQKLQQSQGKLECVWSGKTISQDLNIEYLIPFAIWKNNDLWNLLPAKATINAQKSDKIPSLHLINQRKDCITDYWQKIQNYQSELFNREVAISLTQQAP